jgi:hypothetical protein
LSRVSAARASGLRASRGMRSIRPPPTAPAASPGRRSNDFRNDFVRPRRSRTRRSAPVIGVKRYDDERRSPANAPIAGLYRTNRKVTLRVVENPGNLFAARSRIDERCLRSLDLSVIGSDQPIHCVADVSRGADALTAWLQLEVNQLNFERIAAALQSFDLLLGDQRLCIPDLTAQAAPNKLGQRTSGRP